MARTRSSGSGSPLLTLASIVVAIAALHLAKEILVPLALAIFLSFLLAPLADRLEGWGLGRIPSVISVVAVTFVILGLLGWIVTSQIVDLSSNLNNWKGEIVQKIKEIKPESSVLDEVSKTIDEVSKKISEETPANTPDVAQNDVAANETPASETAPEASDGAQFFDFWNQKLGGSDRQQPVDVRVVGLPPSPLEQIKNWLGPLVAPLSAAGIAIVLVIFMLLKREDQRNRLLQLFGASNLHASTEALTDVTERVSKYLRMQFLINAGYGICVGAGLAAIGVPSAITWGC